MRDNEQTKTNNCGEKEFFFEFFSFFSPTNVLHYFFEHERTVEKPTRERERERERERNDDDADFVNPDFNKNDDSDDEKNERERSSK